MGMSLRRYYQVAVAILALVFMSSTVLVTQPVAWSASVTAKTLENGILTVVLEYTNGVSTFQETYSARADQGIDWLPNIVGSRIVQLTALDKVAIDVGPVTPSPTPPPTDPGVALFFHNLTKLAQVQVMVEMGALSATDPNVVALVNQINTDVSLFWNDF